MQQNIDCLRQIVACCRKGDRLDHRHSQWLSDALEKFLTHQCTSMDEALGLRAARGGVPWWLEEAIRKRDLALRQLASSYFAERSLSAQARDVAVLSRRYAATSWRFDCDKAQMPETYEGTPKLFLWQAFKSRAPMPISERHLRNLLAT